MSHKQRLYEHVEPHVKAIAKAYAIPEGCSLQILFHAHNVNPYDGTMKVFILITDAEDRVVDSISTYVTPSKPKENA